LFNLLTKSRLLNLEIEIEKIKLENEALHKKLSECEDAIQLLASNQAYLAKEIVDLSTPEPPTSSKDPLDEYLKKFRSDDDDGGGYLN
tara:strand:+ start:368 stop:631 length:264 start_codon:yes stop_codon:yes gene_type:complete